MNKVFTVFKKEILDSLRDRRTLLTAVVMPIVLMPAIMIGSVKFQEAQITKAAEKPVLLAVENQQSAPTLLDFLNKQKQVELKQVENFDQGIEAGTINVYLNVETDFEANLKTQKPAEVRVVQKSSNVDSSTAYSKVINLLQAFNQEQARIRLSQKGLATETLSALKPVSVDIATAQERGGFFIGLLLPMFIVVFAIAGGMYIAIDVSAGEKERKTLEALLLSPASRLQLVAGKFAAVAATASASIILSMFSLYFAFKFFPPKFGTEVVEINLTLGAIGIMLLVGVIMAIMFSGLLLSVAIFAKSYKEAQNYITPFYLLAILPVAIFAQLPGLKPSLGMFFIPGVNAVFVMKEALIKTFDSAHIFITFGSLIIYAVIAVIAASKIYSKEGILFRD